jgi:hypothetical protein
MYYEILCFLLKLKPKISKPFVYMCMKFWVLCQKPEH